MGAAQQTYDLSTWNALLHSDADIATAAAYLGEFGQRYVDDLAESYLAIGEKRYLGAIVAKIQREAEDEARADNSRNLKAPATAGTANDSARSTARRDPEFDVAKWNELASEDPEIEAAIIAVGRFGSYYVADLAASYQAIDDKRYLPRIIETIVAEAEAELDRPPDWPALSEAPSQPETVRPKPAGNSASASRWDGRLEAEAQQFASDAASRGQADRSRAGDQFSRPRAANSANRSPRLGAAHSLALAALVVILLVLSSTVAIMLYEYSIFCIAHGDVDRLQAYGNQCRICVFKGEADAEATSLRLVAIENEKARRRNEIVAYEWRLFQAAHGDIDRLLGYRSRCEICANFNEATAEVVRLRQQAADTEAARLRETAIAVDENNYRAARGDIGQLTAYLRTCVHCAFRSNAEAELNELQRQADSIIAQARIAELQRQQQLREPPRRVTWRIINNSGLAINVQFFSLTRFGLAWPGSNMSWPMTTGQSSDYNLECETGEKICFGIAAPFRTESWGVGGSGTQGCTDCCYTCDGALHAVNLAPIAGLGLE